MLMTLLKCYAIKDVIQQARLIMSRPYAKEYSVMNQKLLLKRNYQFSVKSWVKAMVLTLMMHEDRLIS